MEEKKNKDRRLNLSMTEELHSEISAEAEKLELSLSAYCIQAINKSLGKVTKPDPKTITVEPVEIYTQDVQDCLSKIGNTAASLDRLIFTLSQKSNVAEYELQRLVNLTNQLREEEKAFNEHMVNVYEERVKMKKEILKRIDKQFKKLEKG